MSDTNRSQGTNAIKDIWPSERLLNAYVQIGKKDKRIAGYVVRKASRIAAVSLVLTALIEDSPEICADMQRSSVRIVALGTESIGSTQVRVRFLREVLHLMALLETAAYADMLDVCTVRAVVDDVAEFSEFLERHGWFQGQVAHIDHYLGVHAPLMSGEEDCATSESVTDHGQVREGRTGGSSGSRVRKNGVDYVQHQQRERVGSVQKDRRASILGLLQHADRITVKDVSAVVTGCSEKTLQRELLALVAQGVLVKEGERRWSTYRLA